MQTIGLLIFDLDGTLVNTLGDIAASVNHVLSRLGRERLPAERVRAFVGDGVRTLLVRALGGDESRLSEALALYREHHRAHLVVHSSLYPGVLEILEHFKDLPLAVISNKATEFIAPLLDGLRIGGYFANIIGADQGIPLKPAPDALLRIMSQTRVAATRTVMVGDGTTDIRAGRAAGVITCAAAWGFRSDDELRREGPDHVIHEVRELTTLFIPEPQGNIPGGADRRTST